MPSRLTGSMLKLKISVSSTCQYKRIIIPISIYQLNGSSDTVSTDPAPVPAMVQSADLKQGLVCMAPTARYVRRERGRSSANFVLNMVWNIEAPARGPVVCGVLQVRNCVPPTILQGSPLAHQGIQGKRTVQA